MTLIYRLVINKLRVSTEFFLRARCEFRESELCNFSITIIGDDQTAIKNPLCLTPVRFSLNLINQQRNK